MRPLVMLSVAIAIVLRSVANMAWIMLLILMRSLHTGLQRVVKSAGSRTLLLSHRGDFLSLSILAICTLLRVILRLSNGTYRRLFAEACPDYPEEAFEEDRMRHFGFTDTAIHKDNGSFNHSKALTCSSVGKL